jgi:oligopeptide/dipeptide ABC transporter ATP-binding protein
MLKLDRVSKTYRVGTFGGTDLPAVRDVSFEVETGEVVSLIGESGSGKTTIGRMILRLASISRGSITFNGTDIRGLGRGGLKAYYRNVQGVFQDPFSSFNPVFKADRVFRLIKDVYYPQIGAAAWNTKVGASLEAVSLDPGQVLHKYPHQLSGGQLQRLLIARALLLDLQFLVADEIISMLDASTRIDVLNVLGELKARGLGILFITHDLSLGNYISDRTVILRRGAAVEMGVTERVFGNPLHPYTQALVASVPHLHEKWADGNASGPELDGGAGGRCVYHERYPAGGAGVGPDGERPSLVEAEDGHYVACSQVDGKGACAANVS